MTRVVSWVRTLFRHRPASPPVQHVACDEAGRVVATWRGMTPDEVQEFRERQRGERPRRWLERHGARRSGPRW